MILIVDMNYRRDSLGFYEFVLPIVSAIKGLEKYKIRHHNKLVSSDIDECSRIILSGNALKNKQALAKIEDFTWVKKCEKPILGICAGMQTIGLIFDSSLTRCLEIGMVPIKTLNENPLFSSSFKAYELHSYSVRPSEELDVLAKSEKCVQAVKVKNKEIYGVLFHPEVRNSEIIERFASLRARDGEANVSTNMKGKESNAI